jgi:lactoylglutathione lyase
MPRIEHIALWVSDLEVMSQFYSEYFQAKVGSLYENTKKGFASRFLSFDDGTRIELMTTTGALTSNTDRSRAFGLTHLAISLGSTEKVDRLTNHLKSSGVIVVDGPRKTGDGYYESVILDPEGNRIELTV